MDYTDAACAVIRAALTYKADERPDTFERLQRANRQLAEAEATVALWKFADLYADGIEIRGRTYPHAHALARLIGLAIEFDVMPPGGERDYAEWQREAAAVPVRLPDIAEAAAWMRDRLKWEARTAAGSIAPMPDGPGKPAREPEPPAIAPDPSVKTSEPEPQPDVKPGNGKPPARYLDHACMLATLHPGLAQKEIAKAVGVHSTTLGRNPRFKDVQRIAREKEAARLRAGFVTRGQTGLRDVEACDNPGDEDA